MFAAARTHHSMLANIMMFCSLSVIALEEIFVFFHKKKQGGRPTHLCARVRVCVYVCLSSLSLQQRTVFVSCLALRTAPTRA